MCRPYSQEQSHDLNHNQAELYYNLSEFPIVDRG